MQFSNNFVHKTGIQHFIVLLCSVHYSDAVNFITLPIFIVQCMHMLRKTQIRSLHFHFHSTNTHMWKILTLHCGVTFSLPRLHYHFNVVPYRIPTLVFVMIDYWWYCHSVHSRALPSITHLSLYLIWALPAAVVAGNSVIFNNQICSAAYLFYVCWATCHRDTDLAVRHHCRG